MFWYKRFTNYLLIHYSWYCNNNQSLLGWRSLSAALRLWRCAPLTTLAPMACGNSVLLRYLRLCRCITAILGYSGDCRYGLPPYSIAVALAHDAPLAAGAIAGYAAISSATVIRKLPQIQYIKCMV